VTGRGCALAIGAGGAASLALAVALNAGQSTVDLIVLGIALAAGYEVELNPGARQMLPLGFAIVPVLLRAGTPLEFVAIVSAAGLFAAVFGPTQAAPERWLQFATYLAAALAAGAIYQLLMQVHGYSHNRFGVFSALVGAAAIEVFVVDATEFGRMHTVVPLRARGADLALVTSATLMAIGYAGIDGQGQLGLWGVALFSIPLLAAWYSFKLLAQTRRTFEETVHALGVAPELAGLVREGHAARVATLAVEIGVELGFSTDDLRDLETAAWLHHLGAVALDDPRAGDSSDVTRATAGMLRSSDALSTAGDILAAESAVHRTAAAGVEPRSDVLGQILRVAHAFDESTAGGKQRASSAVEALLTDPAEVADRKVLAALESVVQKRRPY